VSRATAVRAGVRVGAGRLGAVRAGAVRGGVVRVGAGRGRAVRAGLVGAVGGGLLLAGCGIPATGVVEAGEPAVGVHREVKLYFVRGRDPDALAVVSRRLEAASGFEDSLALLFKGLSPAESKVLDLTTRVPMAPVKVGYADGRVTVYVGVPDGRLSPVAVDQIVCTALAAGPADPDRPPDTVTVVVAGEVQHGSPDGTGRCARAVVPTPVTKPGAKTFGGAEGP
jgi:hypothetical protein